MAHKVLKKKRVFLMLLLVAVGFVFFAHGVLAQTAPTQLAECSLLDFSCFIDKFFYGILWFLAIILSYVAMITNWAMQPSPITTSFFVQAGWKATRDFANMFFILILLGIALDFILFNSFGVKRALPKLLLIALLINFSIPIAGVFIDFANIVSSFFLNQVSGGGFTEAIAQSVGLAKVLDANTIGTAATAINGVQNIATTANNSFINILFSIGLLAGMIFIFAALAVMFLFRTGILSVLLILLPIVLVLYAFPPSSRHFGKWMSKFTQWTMFAPTATFFLYLSMLLLIQTGSNGILSMGGTTTITESSFAYTLLRYVMVWMLMLMSLTVAQSMGITGASTAMAMWSTGTKWARGKAYGAARGAAISTARWAKPERALDYGAGKAEQNKWVARAGGGMVARGLRSIAARTEAIKEKQGELTSQEKARLSTYSPDRLREEIKSREKSLSPGLKATIPQLAAMLAEKSGLNVKNADGTVNEKESTKWVQELIRTAEKYNASKDIKRSIGRANPYANMLNIEEDHKKGSEATQKDINTWVNPKTGKTLDEALKTVFDISSLDMDKMKGIWTDRSMEAFMKYGMNASHIQRAAKINDGKFLTILEKILKAEEMSYYQDKQGNKNIQVVLEENNKSLHAALKRGAFADIIESSEKYKEEKSKKGGPFVKKVEENEEDEND